MALTRDRASSILKSKGMTDFQIKVLLATMRIPRGEVVTYKELAKDERIPQSVQGGRHRPEDESTSPADTLP